MATLGKFNPKKFEPLGSFKAIPKGRYKVAIKKSELKKTKSGNGDGFLLGLSVIKGKYKGSPLSVWINWTNPSKMAMELGRREMSSICHATGVMDPDDTSELHEIPFYVDVDVEDDRNRIVAYYSVKKAEAMENGETVADDPATDDDDEDNVVPDSIEDEEEDEDAAPWEDD